jgi:hypothetical protein
LRPEIVLGVCFDLPEVLVNGELAMRNGKRMQVNSGQVARNFAARSKIGSTLSPKFWLSYDPFEWHREVNAACARVCDLTGPSDFHDRRI